MSFAFRMTGSLSEAEDIVQETFLECADISAKKIQNHKSWLTKVCTNKALDYCKRAYKKRETYPGTWLPDQVPHELQFWENLKDVRSPEKSSILTEGLTTSFLLLLENLSPEERLVYLLKDVFEWPYKDIGVFLHKSEDTCRKISQRAREAVEKREKKFGPPPKEAEKLIANFFKFAKEGDLNSLTELITPTAQALGDGGGKVAVASLSGSDSIAKYFISLSKAGYFDPEHVRIEFHQINSRPGITISERNENGSWKFNTITSFEFENGKIAMIYGQRNPEKLDKLICIHRFV